MPLIPYGNYFLWKRAADHLLKQYIDEQGSPDIVHAHSAIFAGAVASHWKDRLDIPVVLTEHSSAFARGTLQSWKLGLAKKATTTVDSRIAVSPALGKLLSDTLGGSQNDWTWVPNIVAERFRPDEKSEQKAKRPIRFLNLALMTKNKGQFYLLEAFAMGFQNENCHLWFGGNGPLRRQLEKTAKRLGVSDQVHFLGMVPPAEVPELLRKVDVMVIASHYETFGLVAAEALMSGTPVIATRCGGPECIIEHKDGLMVPPKNPDELSKALVHMVDLLPRLNSADISARARLRFSADVVGAQLEHIYAGLVMNKDRAAPSP